MNRVLITGFEPFGGEPRNPSAEVAQALHGQVIAGRRVVGAVLPCVFGAARTALLRQLRSLAPELVLCTGQAGGRAAIALERVAINVDDARIADNAGKQPIDRPVVKGGPVGYWSTLPIKSIVRALTDAGLPAEVSQTAGTFVCNHTFYALMHALSARRGARGGFVHLPYLPEQTLRLPSPAPSLPRAEAIRAMELAIATALATRRDVRMGAGATH